MFFFYSTLFALVLFGATLYLTRQTWLPLLSHRYSPLMMAPSFANDIEAGLSSATFSLDGNIAEGDSRAGLDGEAKAKILKIMKSRRLHFDEARRVYMEARFQDNGIAADGRPRDPKFVSFS
jgi:hypothetical protein